MIKKLLIITLLFTNSIFALGDKGSFGLNINSDDLEVEGRVSLSTRTRSLEYRNFYIDGNFINGEDDNLYGIGFYVENSPRGYSNITFNIGLRSIFSGNDKLDETFVAIPITVGAKARMYLGNLPKSALGFKLAYAPDPLSFSDAKSYFEYRIEVDMQLIDNIDIYAGYRDIDTEYKGGDITFNSAGYVGFKFIF
jgi:hypothetical protein